MYDIVKNKIILITGGTGSIGYSVCKEFLNHDVKEIRIISRSKSIQEIMLLNFNDSRLKFYVADIKNYDEIDNIIKGCDFVIHLAAMKSISSCEDNPMEAVNTNIIGSYNVLKSLIKNNVTKAIFISSSLAVQPVSTVGMTKSIMEKIILKASNEVNNCSLCVLRLGNVLFTRGSVLPLFYKNIDEGKDLTVTDENMTRFMMTSKDVFESICYLFNFGRNGDIAVKKCKSIEIGRLANLVLKYKKSDSKIVNIGKRPGERVNEVLLTADDMKYVTELDDYYIINKKSIINENANYDYNSFNCEKYTDEEFYNILLDNDSME